MSTTGLDVNNVDGYYSYAMTGSRLPKRVIFLSRHGESEYNITGRVGGDGSLSANGKLYAKQLANYIEGQAIPDLTVWTSTYKRTKQTARYIRFSNIEHRSHLDELKVGICDGLTYEEIADRYPIEMARRDQDKFRYRYPKGESYEDVISRLQPIVEEMYSFENLLIICHQAVARCLLGNFFVKTEPSEVPYVEVPLHTVFKCTFVGRDLDDVEVVGLPVEHVDTYRRKPEDVSEGRTAEAALETVPPHEEAEV